MKNKDLAQIVMDVQKNKDKHFEKLYSVTWETVYFLSFNMLDNKNDAEDITQEVFIIIYNKIDQLKLPEAFNTWMKRIVINLCKRVIEKRPTELILNHIDEENDINIEETYIDFLPADLINSKETRTIIDTIIQELPEKQKQAILLHYYQEFSVSQIAEILECTTTIVNSRLHYAKVTLRSKAECFQKNHGIKLYNVSAIPVLSVILKMHASEVCNDTIKVSIWNEVFSKVIIGTSIPVVSKIKKILSKAKNNPLSSVASTSSSFLSNAVIVVGATSMIVSTGFVVNNYINQEKGNNIISISNEVEKTKEDINNKVVKKDNKDGNSKVHDDVNNDLFTEDITTILDTKIYIESQLVNEEPIISMPAEVVQGTKISTISTTSSEMNLPAGSIITNGVGDRIFMASDGTLETDGSITTAGNIATVPFALVNQIQLDSLGNRLLPTGTILNNLDGTTSTYSGNIQVDKQNNSIKKLPFEVDVASGDLNIELIDDKLVITGSDVEIIIEKDTVIDIINTSSEDRTIIVDGCDVAFGKTEATIKVINDGRAIRQTITTTSTVKNFIPGTISTTTKRNKQKGSQSLLEPVKKEVNDRLSLDTNPLAKTNGEKETMLNMMIIINLIILVIIILLFVYKHKEKEKMKLKNILKTTAITFLAIFVASNGMMNNLLAEEEQEPTVGIGETTKVEPVTPEQEVEIITNEEDKVEASTPVATASASLGFNEVKEVASPYSLSTGWLDNKDDSTMLAYYMDEGLYNAIVSYLTVGGAKGVDPTLVKAQAFTGNVAIDFADTSTPILQNTTLRGIDVFKTTKRLAFYNGKDKITGSLPEFNDGMMVETMDISNNTITELDVTKLVNLTSLRCLNNQIKVLNVTTLANLTSLVCNGNQIADLDVSTLEKLKTLSCSTNLITELDVSNLIDLSYINCEKNSIMEIDVSKLKNLTTLNVNSNKISELDISNLTNLVTLYCSTNQISKLDVKALKKLKYLNCSVNLIEVLDVSDLTNLLVLNCGVNQISSLEVLALTDMTSLSCTNNKISSLDVSTLTNLTALNINSNQIKDIDLSTLEKLKTFNCAYNQITYLDLLSLSDLNYLNYAYNQIIDLDTTALTSLTYLNCASNKIINLDVSHLKKLTSLTCSSNLIKNLDVTELTELTYLNCGTNQLSSLNLSTLVKLNTLSCDTNKITALDVSNLSELTGLICYNNSISELDVSNLPNLNNLQVFLNPISELNINDLAKANLTTLYYRSTNIETMDLSGFTSLVALNVTRSTNADLSNLTTLYVSGNRSISDKTLVRLAADMGGFSWDATTGYYVIAPNSNAKYGFNVPTVDKSSGYVVTPIEEYIEIAKGGLADKDGNLIIGVTLDGVDFDGTISLPGGTTLITPEGTIMLNSDSTIKDGIIKTNGNFSLDKNTTAIDSITGLPIPVTGGNKTTVEVGNGVTTINTNGSEMSLPAGSEVTNNDGDKTYLNEAGTVDSLGVVNSDGITVTVPADKVGDIAIDEDGLIIIPKGSTIKDEDGITSVYPGGIVIDETNHTVTELPLDFYLSAGPITITVNGDGQNVVNQNGVDTILDKDVVINILNTEDTDNKVVVEGSEITIENIDGDLEAVNGSDVHVTGDVTGNVTIDDTSTVTVDGTIGGSVTNNGGNFNGNGNITGDVTTNNGGTSIIVGNVDGYVITDGTDSTTNIGGNVDGTVTDSNGGETTVGGNAIYALQTADAYALLEKVNAVDATKYTKASITKLNDAKVEVMNILEPATLTRAILTHPSQASLDATVANLQAAYDGLVLINVVVNPTKQVVSTGLELPLMSIVALSFGVSAIILRRRYIK